MTKLNYKACRNLTAATLYQALKDVAYGPLKYKLEATRWIDGQESRHLADALGITKWPPETKSYDRLREEYRNRIAWMER